MRFPVIICFYFPLVTNALNVQAFISKFVSDTFAQTLAYLNMALIFVGILYVFKKRDHFAPLIKWWIAFFLVYYSLALVANIYLNTQPPLLKTLVPIIYFLGFSFLLSDREEIKPVCKVLAVSFFISCIFLIIFNFLNFSIDFEGVYQYKIERAGGVYGDANNASVAAILSFVFFKQFIHFKTKIGQVFKIAVLLISVYGVILTFSKTGIVVFLIVLALTYHKFFSVKKILFTALFLPLALYGIVEWARTSLALSFVQKQRIESLVNIATLNTEQVGFSERDVLLQNMLNFIAERPFMGNGVNFSTIIRGHNTIIGVWADAGILAFMIFLVLLAIYYKKSLTAPKNIKFFALSVLVTLTLFMLTLQSIINQGYLMTVFVLLAYILYDFPNPLKLTDEKNPSFT